MSKRKFVILGGGTAGWITAHTIRKWFPDDNITVVYSLEKEIVGVGEATTPQIVDFLTSIGISIPEFLKKTGGTIKHGISFENWNGDGEKYLHPFYEKLVDFNIPGIFGHSSFDFYLKTLISKKLSFDDYLYQNRIAYANKIDLNNTTFALHFDTYKFGKFLEEYAVEKNIQIIKEEFKTAVQDQEGKIVKILTDDNEIDCDFIFDCTGFHRVLIGNVYKQEWISYKKYLPMKKAISFWINAEEQIPPYTAAIAMKYGWMWKIPLQDRFGCGYVYDSDYIDEHEAQQEAQEYYGKNIEVRKVIDIDAGRYQNIWVKNCIAVGLSNNFIEPLESTSIWLQLSLLSNLKQFLNNIDDLDPKSIELFNEINGNEVDEKMNFVHLHYLTKRNDSKFWKEFKSKTETPKLVKELLPIVEEGHLKYYYLQNYKCPGIFPLMSWLCICSGLELFKNGLSNDNYEKIQPSPEIYKAIIDSLIDSVPDQRKYLDSI